MSLYGQKLIDGADFNILTASGATLISAGTVAMPNSLNGDGTYGYDVDLPGSAAISVSKIGVVCLPSAQQPSWEGHVIFWNSGSPLHFVPAWYVRSGGANNYYTKNDVTGVMSSYTPGDMTPGDTSKWDGIISVFPIVGWDRVASTITAVRLWAAMCYLMMKANGTYQAIYCIGNTGGITSVDYAIFMKEWDY